MSRHLQRLMLHPLFDRIFLCLLAIVYVMSLLGFGHFLNTWLSVPSVAIAEHTVDTNPDTVVKYWTAASMRSATDADQQISEASGPTVDPFIYPVYPHTPTRGELTTGSIISDSSLRLAHLLQYAFSSTLKYPATTFVAGFPHTLQRMTGGTFLARIVTGSSSSPSWITSSLSETTLRLSSVVDPKSYS